jgi:hypothetical protein
MRSVSIKRKYARDVASQVLDRRLKACTSVRITWCSVWVNQKKKRKKERGRGRHGKWLKSFFLRVQGFCKRGEQEEGSPARPPTRPHLVGLRVELEIVPLRQKFETCGFVEMARRRFKGREIEL